MLARATSIAASTCLTVLATAAEGPMHRIGAGPWPFSPPLLSEGAMAEHCAVRSAAGAYWNAHRSGAAAASVCTYLHGMVVQTTVGYGWETQGAWKAQAVVHAAGAGLRMHAGHIALLPQQKSVRQADVTMPYAEKRQSQ